MSIFVKTLSYLLPLLTTFILHNWSSLTPFIPQIIALLCVFIILSFYFFKRLSLSLITTVIHLIILSTGGINSFLFFLIYFLLFSLAFQNPPTVNLIYSLITILFYSFNLNSFQSLIQLLSLLLITPLSYFIALSRSSEIEAQKHLSRDQTDFLLWLSLRLKKPLQDIISLSDQSQVRNIAKDLLKDAHKLTDSISSQDDDT